ncbi:MAG: PEFG-CTERM sorting domain-containing protein, partial [Nitrosopumilaceae archaeon]
INGNAIIYGSDPAPSNDPLVTIYLQKPSGEKALLTKDLVTHGNGEFDFSFPITEGFEIGKYTFTLQFTKGDFQSEPNEEQSPFYVARKSEFLISAEGRDFPVYVESIEFEISNMAFDKESKSLTFDAKRIPAKYAHDDYLQFQNKVGMIIKRPLIDAPFSTLVDGKESYFDPYETRIDEEFSKLQVYVVDIKDTGKVSVVGTYAVPEFGALAFMILLVAVSAILLISKFIYVSINGTKVNSI